MRNKTNRVISRTKEWTEISIATPKFPDLKMIIDTDDYKAIRARCKSRITPKKGPKESSEIYARMRIDGKLRMLHRVVLGMCGRMLDIDHINHNTLDNRRCNLRICTRRENLQNYNVKDDVFSSMRGITKIGPRRFKVSIKDEHSSIVVGVFSNKLAATKARLEAEIKHYGEFMPEENKQLAKEYGLL